MIIHRGDCRRAKYITARRKGLILFLVLLAGPAAVQAQSVSPSLDHAIGSVVTVAVYETEEFGSRQLGFRGADKPSVSAYEKALNLTGSRSSGSGFVINRDGRPFVITNAHVIENAAALDGSIRVFSVNRTAYDVRVVGGDSFYDLAVLEFVTPPGGEVTAVEFREEEAVVGERVYAIGNPLGEFPYSVSEGIISARNRVREGITGKFGFLQTTATVIWGNSGGPLVDRAGKVVGINSQVAFTEGPDGSEMWLSQINFALEGPLSIRLIDDILENGGRVDRAYFGLEITERQEYDQTTYSYQPQKLILSDILPDAPSAPRLRSFLGAVVSRVNGEAVRTAEQVLYELEKVRSGETATFTFERDGEPVELELNSKPLTGRELESVATRFLDGIRGLDRQGNLPGVQFSLSAEAVILKYDEGYYLGMELFDLGSPGDYILLAAGISRDYHERMWVVDELSDLGVALRLSGLSGEVDLVVTGDREGEEIEYLRKSFSDAEYMKQKKLWY